MWASFWDMKLDDNVKKEFHFFYCFSFTFSYQQICLNIRLYKKKGSSEMTRVSLRFVQILAQWLRLLFKFWWVNTVCITWTYQLALIWWVLSYYVFTPLKDFHNLPWQNFKTTMIKCFFLSILSVARGVWCIFILTAYFLELNLNPFMADSTLVCCTGFEPAKILLIDDKVWIMNKWLIRMCQNPSSLQG